MFPIFESMRIYLPVLFFTILITSCLENTEINNPVKELFRTYGKESGINYSAGIEYEFVDSLTLTGYTLSIPSEINCDIINSTQSLLECFPELDDVVKEIERLTKPPHEGLIKISESTWVDDIDSDIVYAPDRMHFYSFEMFTVVIDQEGEEKQLINYALHPFGGTATFDYGTLPVKR